MAKRRRSLKQWIMLAIAIFLVFFFALTIYEGRSNDQAQVTADIEAAKTGDITGTPWTPDSPSEPDSEGRLYPDHQGELAVPTRGLRVPIVFTEAPQDWSAQAWAETWSSAHGIAGEDYTSPRSQQDPDATGSEQTVILTLNSSQAVDASGNPLLVPDDDTEDPTIGTELIVDGFLYEVEDLAGHSLTELVQDASPLHAPGKLVILIYGRDTDGSHTTTELEGEQVEVVAITAAPVALDSTPES